MSDDPLRRLAARRIARGSIASTTATTTDPLAEFIGTTWTDPEHRSTAATILRDAIAAAPHRVDVGAVAEKLRSATWETASEFKAAATAAVMASEAPPPPTPLPRERGYASPHRPLGGTDPNAATDPFRAALDKI